MQCEMPGFLLHGEAVSSSPNEHPGFKRLFLVICLCTKLNNNYFSHLRVLVLFRRC